MLKLHIIAIYPRGNHVFVKQGTGANIPKYLRFEGKVKNRRISKRDALLLIKDVWEERLSSEIEVCRLVSGWTIFVVRRSNHRSISGEPTVTDSLGGELTANMVFFTYAAIEQYD